MKIQIKVAINAEGDWCAYGFSKAAKPSDLDDVIYESVYDEGGIQAYWVTADVPLPGVPEIVADNVKQA